jgi:DNA topoisomerase-3
MLVATDAGREGELIARIVFREAGISDISRVRRFRVSEALTKEVIRKGMEAARPWREYDRIALEGAVRQQADWLIGINLTRCMTGGNNTLFSVEGTDHVAERYRRKEQRCCPLHPGSLFGT